MTIGWIVGRSGLLGGALHRVATRRQGWSSAESPSLPWGRPAKVEVAASRAFRELLVQSTRLGEPWSVLWVAGAGVTHTSEAGLASELSGLRAVLAGCLRHLPEATQPGVLFYASSAGGVYAGAASPPFTEDSFAVPLSPYGASKLESERLVTEFAQRNGLSCVIGRIANLYGPGQRLDKMQGLISHLALAQCSDRPAKIYVPLDTIRDYVYSDDCAALILDVIDRTRIAARWGPVSVTKILASGDGVTVGNLIGVMKTITKRKPNVMLLSSPNAAFQSSDLRFRSVVWPELDARELTPLAAGIQATLHSIVTRLQNHGYPAHV